MNKSIKKRQNYNEDILLLLQKKFGYSIDYIRKALRGDRMGIMPDIIKKEYKVLLVKINETLKPFKDQVL